MTLRKKSQRFLTQKYFNQGREEKKMTETGRKLSIKSRSCGFNSPPLVTGDVWTWETKGASNRNIAYFYNASPPREGGTYDLFYNSQKSRP